MKDFARLFEELDQTNKVNVRVKALADFFAQADDVDRLWTIAILSHRRPKRIVNTTMLRSYAAEMAGIPLWLFEETYHVVGDLAESIALILPEATLKHEPKRLSDWIVTMLRLQNESEEVKKAFILQAWDTMDYSERFVFNKLITGGFRLGVSQKLMTRALAKFTGVAEDQLAHRLMGSWSPESTTFKELVLDASEAEDSSKPYPFYLAYALDQPFESLGPHEDWQAEWKWDGIRAQLIARSNEKYLWSRGEELVNDQFPELVDTTLSIPNGTVIDGELVVYKENKIQSFNELQTRLGRKQVSKKMLSSHPVAIVAYDILEYKGEDIRHYTLSDRRNLLEKIIATINRPERVFVSPIVSGESWEDLEDIRSSSRENLAEGLMLKRKSAPYLIGRKKGDWWKWKVEPMTIDAVMIYAQRGHGRRANLYTDYTFAVWDRDLLVPFTKAYSGLTDKEFNEVTAFVRKNTLEKFGPVRSVKPELVFEIGFEGIRASPRHKSGIALRFPRILRWRKDKPSAEANTLQDLQSLLV
jgi:DNA ligase-1